MPVEKEQSVVVLEWVNLAMQRIVSSAQKEDLPVPAETDQAWNGLRNDLTGWFTAELKGVKSSLGSQVNVLQIRLWFLSILEKFGAKTFKIERVGISGKKMIAWLRLSQEGIDSEIFPGSESHLIGDGVENFLNEKLRVFFVGLQPVLMGDQQANHIINQLREKLNLSQSVPKAGSAEDETYGRYGEGYWDGVRALLKSCPYKSKDKSKEILDLFGRLNERSFGFVRACFENKENEKILEALGKVKFDAGVVSQGKRRTESLEEGYAATPATQKEWRIATVFRKIKDWFVRIVRTFSSKPAKGVAPINTDSDVASAPNLKKNSSEQIGNLLGVQSRLSSKFQEIGAFFSSISSRIGNKDGVATDTAAVEHDSPHKHVI